MESAVMKPAVSKFVQQIRKEQDLNVKHLNWFKLGEKPYNCPKYEQLKQKISETLENYQNNDLICS